MARTGIKAPVEGRYRGTVNGHPAVIGVIGDCVNAIWLRPARNGCFLKDEAAWDVVDGRFEATLRGEPVRCSIVLSSRV